MILNVAIKPIVKKALQYTGKNIGELVEFTKCKVLSSGDESYITVDIEGSVLVILTGYWVLKNQFGEYHVLPNDQFRNIYYVCEEKKENEIWSDADFNL